ncbi:hypothetical protein [Streptomyces sp. AF1A]|uniref:hypothetical protein n=1 Tax=Streptomyces sp. AF1A TaxID=3394350 RepID=UPI0039BCDF00
MSGRPQQDPTGCAGVPHVVPRPPADLAPLLDWLRAGRPAEQRLDFAAGTALPHGRLDLCKQGVGARGAALIAAALSEGPSPVRHLLPGTDALGDEGAAAVAGADVETLHLGCNGITAAGACRIADQLRASPQVVTGVWLKRNPLGAAGGRAGAELLKSARSLRTLDLVQTGLDATGAAVLADALPSWPTRCRPRPTRGAASSGSSPTATRSGRRAPGPWPPWSRPAWSTNCTSRPPGWAARAPCASPRPWNGRRTAGSPGCP